MQQEYQTIKINGEYKKNGIIATSGDIFMPYHSKSKYEFTLGDDEWILLKDNIFIDSNWQKAVDKK